MAPLPSIQRLLRHLEFARGAIGEAGAPDLAAWLLVSDPEAPVWTPLPPGAAALMNVQERLMIGIGYHRRKQHQRTKATRPSVRDANKPSVLIEVDRLEASFVWAALWEWLPRLGPVGMRVRDRMEAHGSDAVLHHLISELCEIRGQTPVLRAAGILREAMLAIDSTVVAASDNDRGTDLLQKERIYIEKRMIADLADLAEGIGWDALACLWMSQLHGIGVSTSSLGQTERFDDAEAQTAGAFDLLAAYAVLLD